MIGALHCLHCVVFVLYMPMCYGDRAVLKFVLLKVRIFCEKMAGSFDK